jgi:hypothetical protein
MPETAYNCLTVTLYGHRLLSALIYFIWLPSIETKDDRKQTSKRWGRKTDLILWIIVAANTNNNYNYSY